MRAHVLLSVAALCAGGRQTSDRCLHTTSFARHTTARPPRDPPRQTSVRRKHTSCFLWLLYAPVGGGPPARSPHASLTARNDRSRGPPWPCRRPPAPQPQSPQTTHHPPVGPPPTGTAASSHHRFSAGQNSPCSTHQPKQRDKILPARRKTLILACFTHAGRVLSRI